MHEYTTAAARVESEDCERILHDVNLRHGLADIARHAIDP